MNTVAKGTNFEKEVEILLGLLRFKLERNALVNGTQIDLLATKDDPLNNLSYVVECADREATIGVDLVKEKASVLLTLKDDQKMFRLLFVSKSGFTAEARAFSRAQAQVVLLNLNQLEDLIIDLTPYKNNYISAFEQSRGMFQEASLITNYVNLRARDDKGQVIESLNRYANTWLKDETNNLLFLLGDYGAGKSSFCRTWAYRLLKEKYDTDKSQRYTPILINLKDARGKLDLKALVVNTLSYQYGVKLDSFATFEHLCNTGNVLLLLDGFDEMSERSDTPTLFDCFNQIYLFAALNTKIVLTCRSNFFQSHKDVINLIQNFSITLRVPQEEALLDLFLGDQGAVIYVEKLNVEQVREFIQKRMGDKADGMLETIARIHDLSDLSTRPVLLDMIVSTLPRLEKAKSRINSASLYALYTDNWTKRDQWRARLPLKIRRSFCEVLAWEMHCSNKISLSFAQLEKALTKAFQEIAETKEQLEKFKNDIQTCSFLVRDSNDDQFRFAHKSFIEYFVASKIVADLYGGVPLRKPESDAGFDSIQNLINTVEFSFADMPIANWTELLHGAFKDRVSQMPLYMSLLDSEVKIRWPSISSDASLRSHLEGHIRSIFGGITHHAVPNTPIVTEEIATFCVELFFNNKADCLKLINLTGDERSSAVLCDLIRLAKPSDWFKDNYQSIKQFLKTKDRENLRIAFLAALAHNTGLLDGALLLDCRQNLSPEGWSYVLFEVSHHSSNAKQILERFSAGENLSPVDQVIVIYGTSEKLSSTDWDERIPNLLIQLLNSDKKEERELAANVGLVLPQEKRLTVVIHAFHKAPSKRIKHELIQILQNLAGADSWKQLRGLAAKEMDGETKAALLKAEQLMRNAASEQTNRNTWIRAKGNTALRENIWKGLRRK